MTTWARFRANRTAMAGLVVLAVLVVVALLAPLIAPFDETERSRPFRDGPSWDHLFGTDRIGRDVFSRVILGLRVTLRVALAATLLTAVIGVAVGATAGFVGRWVDAVLMRTVDVLLSIPYVILALSLAIVFGRGEGSVILVVGLTGWLPLARIVRSTVLSLKEREFVLAATGLGLSRWRVLWRHVLPNALGPIVAYATIAIGGVILAEATLSYLGVGSQDPTPAWGLMVEQARGELRSSSHSLLFPAGAIVVTVLSFLAVGDGLRDAVDRDP